MKEITSIKNHIKNHNLATNSLDLSILEKIIDEIFNCFKKGNKLLICGNGGSAADAIHLAGEFMCIGLPAIALAENISTVTAIGNDYNYYSIFDAQINVFAKENDVLLLLSTSGDSFNIIKAARIGKDKKCKVICFTGLNPDYKLEEYSNYIIKIQSFKTEIIQEVYYMINHIIYITIRERLK